MNAGERIPSRLAASVVLASAVFGAIGAPFGAPVEAVTWEVVLLGTLIAIVLIAQPLRRRDGWMV